jgi:hypothetical protein
MIKKDYILIANTLAKNKVSNELIISLCDVFKKDNEKFNANILIRHIEKQRNQSKT